MAAEINKSFRIARWCITIGGIVFFVASLSYYLLAEFNYRALANPTPGWLVCDEASFDYGEILRGATVEHTFVVRNQGTDSIEILDVVPSCGCTAAELSTSIVEPGAELSVDVTVSLKGRQGDQHHTILLRSTDPLRQTYALQISGTVVSQFRAEPSAVNFGMIFEDSTASQTVDVDCTASEGFKVTGVALGSELFAVEQQAMSSGGHRIVVTAIPPLPLGRHDTEIVLQTDSPREPRVSIPITVFVAGDLVIEPQELVLPTGEGSPTNVTIRPGRIKAFLIEKVETPLPDAQVKVLELSDGAFRVLIRGLKCSPELDGQLVVITTNVPEMREIELPIHCATSTAKPGTTISQE